MKKNKKVGEGGLEPPISNTKNLRVYLKFNYDIVSNKVVTRKFPFHYSPNYSTQAEGALIPISTLLPKPIVQYLNDKFII